MKMHKSRKDPDLFYYYNSKNVKMWCYRHRYYDALRNRKEKSKQGFETENSAYRALLQVKQDILNGDIKMVDSSNLTVSQWIDTWYELNENSWKVSTQVQRMKAIRLQIKPLLGKYKLAELDKATYIRVYINPLLKRYKPRTVGLLHRTFKIAVNAAVDNELIIRNRFNNIKIDQGEEAADNFLTPEELNTLLSAAEDEKDKDITNYTLILLLAYTGIRKGESLGLRWSDFDPDNSTISINRTRDQKGVRSPKTKRSKRTIYITDSLSHQLILYKLWCKKLKMSFGKKFSDEEYIFLSRVTGEGVSENKSRYALDLLLKKTGIKKITVHGLRHTHASILVSEGVPVTTIAKRLGNTPDMIFNVYGHSYQSMEMQTVNVFDQSLGALRGSSGGGF
ncbi:Site-specific recombinase XerD [Terribacillus saccharophilus]|uniref:Site-specific recombinase XerD n=1 Tax=Terribacillus saccharophilus TaxID=361277 RepID=A0AAX2ED94_9BACI|nr:Site-specific recombinase XerD [Terribacillus saccharophilus]